MEIVLAEGAGFCFGVKRAINLVYEVLEEEEEPVYTFGPLIHNPQVISELDSKGVKAVESLDEISGGVLILRSHGVSPKIQRQAQDKGLRIVDATCPRVKRVQRLAAKLKEEGYRVVIVGEADHPEVVSILEVAGEADIVESPTSIESLPVSGRIGVIAQTTQHIEQFRELSNLLIAKTEELRIYNTICEASIGRQKNSLKLAREVDLMIVVGGYNSANTRRLAEICQTAVQTHHIEEAQEIGDGWLKGRGRIGVTAGASTPPWIINRVLDRLRSKT